LEEPRRVEGKEEIGLKDRSSEEKEVIEAKRGKDQETENKINCDLQEEKPNSSEISQMKLNERSRVFK